MVAAIHEAAHAVTALKSRFHFIVGEVSVGGYGSGCTNLTKSRAKIMAAAKGQNLSERELAQEYAMILLTGFAAEKMLRVEGDNVVPNRACAEPDYAMALAELERVGDGGAVLRECEASAEHLVAANWREIQRIAVLLLDQGGRLDAVDIVEYLRIDVPRPPS